MDISNFFIENQKKDSQYNNSNNNNNNFLDILKKLMKDNIIDINEYSDAVEYYNGNVSIIRINRFVDILNKIKDKYNIFEKIIDNTFDKSIFEKLVTRNMKSISSLKLLKRMEKNSSFLYSDNQKEACKKIFKFLMNNKDKYFGLYGYAGTGKTTLLIQLVKYLLNNKFIKSVAFTGPTNKVVNVMKSKFRTELKELIKKYIGEYDSNINFDSYIEELNQYGLNIDFLTTHRLLNYQSEFDSNGNKIFVKGNNTNIMSYDVIFIDDCSMISVDLTTNIFEDIKREINNTKKNTISIPKIIFVGDPAQLPPVNEDNSIIFNRYISFDYFLKNFKNNEVSKIELKNIYENTKNELKSIKDYTLKQIVRSDNDKVIGICNNVRSYVIGEIDKPKLGNYRGEKVKIYKKNDNNLKTEWFKNFLKQRDNNKSSSIILTWTNSKTNLYNNEVQRLTIKNRDKKFNVGDVLILNNFYNFEESKSDFKTQFYTSEQIKIIYSDELIKSCPFFDCELKNCDVINYFKPIRNKYKNVINKINKNTQRKYNIFKFGCKKYIGDDKNVKYIYVVKDSSKKILEKDMDITMKEIKKLRNYYEVFYSDQIKKIDSSIIKYLWIEFNKIFVEPFANVSLGNSITCHRAQGSTFYNVYVDADDILKNKNSDDAKRCIYTALTRVSNEVHILI